MTLDIEKIKAAAMAATQGEWKMVRSIPEEGFECFWLMHNDAHFGDIHGPQSGQQLADAEHIVTANPQAVLELITRLREVRRMLQNGTSIKPRRKYWQIVALVSHQCEMWRS